MVWRPKHPSLFGGCNNIEEGKITYITLNEALGRTPCKQKTTISRQNRQKPVPAAALLFFLHGLLLQKGAFKTDIHALESWAHPVISYFRTEEKLAPSAHWPGEECPALFIQA